jgi:hypothetical protein
MGESQNGIHAEIQLAFVLKGTLVIICATKYLKYRLRTVKIAGVRKNLIKNIYWFNHEDPSFRPQTNEASVSGFMLLIKADKLDSNGKLTLAGDSESVELVYKVEDQVKISKTLFNHLRNAADFLDIEEIRGALGVSMQYASLPTPDFHQAKRGYYGCVDLIDDKGIQGWAINMEKPSDPLKIRVMFNNRIIGASYTIFSRNDVSVSAGMPLPACGFHIKWSYISLPSECKQLDTKSACEILVQIEGTNIALVNIKGKWPSVGEVMGWATPPAIPMSGSEKKAIVDAFLAKEYFEDEPEIDVKAIAFFLPQFHPIPENDEWWGAGFTEWTNVAKAKPLFPGHHQPHIPGELGFYDLRLQELRESQVSLARQYGIHGFCYYYYWFNGRRILERPLDDMLRTGKPDFPFCICWANESWSRRWDGSEEELLLKQEHTPEADVAFIRDVIPILKDPRYIKINGSPLLIVYRVSLLPEPKRTIDVWRKICYEEGIKNIHLSAIEFTGFKDPYSNGFDSSIEFPPLSMSPLDKINDQIEGISKQFEGGIYDYREYAAQFLQRQAAPYKRFRGIITGWDNTPRRGAKASLFINSGPENYEMWLRAIVEETITNRSIGERLIFINAWNEWAEGAHLEPDARMGRCYLEATRRALTGRSNWRVLADHARNKGSLSGKELEEWVRAIESQFLAYERSMQYLKRLHTMKNPLEFNRAIFSAVKPSVVVSRYTIKGGYGGLDRVDRQALHDHSTLDSRQCVQFSGWCIAEGSIVTEQSSTIFFLENKETGVRYYASAGGRQRRGDVAQTFPHLEESVTLFSGYNFYGELGRVEIGEYIMGVIQRAENSNLETNFDGVLRIV